MPTLLISLLLALSPHRIAVLDFENLAHERSLDWIGTGIAEALSTELNRIPAYRIVERLRLADVLKEIKFGRSEMADPSTAARMGKLLGADTVVVGSYQKVGDEVRITARFVDVETGEIRSPMMVEGPYKAIFKLQTELASKLAGAELKAAAELNSLEAFQAYSDGVYFLRNDLVADALKQFERALKLEPNYADAQFYRGLGLEKLKKWDDAIAAFKKALPRARPERRVTWSWDAPFAKFDPSKNGVLFGLDTSEISLQQFALLRDELPSIQKQVVYTERNGKNTVLHLLDLEQHAAKRLEIPDSTTDLNTFTVTNDKLMVLWATDKLYGIGTDASVWWHNDHGSARPQMGFVSDLVYFYYPQNRKLFTVNARTFQMGWERTDLNLDQLEPLKIRKTSANGEVAIARSGDTIRALRISDGKDAWVVEPKTTEFTHIVTDRIVILLDRSRRVAFIDIESGKTTFELPVPQYENALNLGPVGERRLAAAVVLNDTVYFESKTKELYAVALDGRVLWHNPIGRTIQTLRVADGRVYVTSPSTGEALILDAMSGAILATVKATPGAMLRYASADVVVVSGEKSVLGLDPVSGAPLWEYPVTFSAKETMYFKGLVIVRTASSQITALDAETGAVLWQYSGKQVPGIFLTKDSFFIVEETGVKEYAIDKAVESVSNKEVMTELANTLMAKKNLSEAKVFLQKAGEIDPDYPPVRLARARLLEQPAELAVYASLVGRDSRAGQQAISELKRDHGLAWYQTLDDDLIGKPQLVAGKLVSVARSVSFGRPIVALNPDNGNVLWRQPTERFTGVVIDAPTERAWFISGDNNDSSAVVLYALSLATGEREELARWKRPAAVTIADISFSKERVFVLTYSPDLTAGLTVSIDCFSPEGKRLWNRTHRLGDLQFSVDGLPEPPAWALWPVLGYTVQGNAGYAFTPDRAAYKRTTAK